MSVTAGHHRAGNQPDGRRVAQPPAVGGRPWQPWQIRIGWVVAYAAVGAVGALTRPEGGQLSLVWPAAGVALLWLRDAAQRCKHPWIDATLLAVVAALTNAVTGTTWGLAVGLGAVGTMQAVTAVAVLRAANQWWAVGQRQLGWYLSLLLGVLAGAVLTAPFVLAVTAFTETSMSLSGWEVMLSWATRNAVCSIVVTTAGLALVSRQPFPARRVELMAFVVVAVGVQGTQFNLPPSNSFGFVMVPLAVWAGLRLGWRTTAIYALVAGLAAIPPTLSDARPFGNVETLSQRVTVSLTLVALLSSVGMVLALVQGERDQAFASLHERELLMRQAMDSALIGNAQLLVTEDQALVVRANPALARLFECPLEMMRGTNWLDLVAVDHQALLSAVLARLHRDQQGTWEGTVRHVTRRGQVRSCRAALAVVPAGQGPTNITLQLMDITESKELEDRLRHLGLHDELTGLPNRTLLSDRIEHALANSRRSDSRMALLFFDLDNFKTINDSLGHPAGDATLIAVADRLQNAVRPGDTVARIGGDEFVVCCPDVEDVTQASDLVQRLTAAVVAPFRLGERTVAVGVSAGITLSQPNSQVEDLIRESDSALYEAKSRGRGRAEFYAAALQARAQRHLDLKGDLRRALDNHEFLVHYQPIIDLDGGRIVALEALVRWQHPTRGLLAPQEWLDVAESSGPINKIDQWVLGEACRHAVACAEAAGTPIDMHVNLSARQLHDRSLCTTVSQILHESGLAPERLVLELTETHLLQVTGTVLDDLQKLRLLRVRMSADDFGTGYSSLTQLIQLPVDELKIDKTFVQTMDVDARAHAIVRGVLGMADAMGLAVVAEGVETPAIAAALRELHCTSAQGYLWSPARPPKAVLELLRADQDPTRTSRATHST